MTIQMTQHEYMSYRAEIYTLERLIKGLTPLRHLERYGLEYRLERARAKIEGVPVPPWPKRLTATFGGAPVIDNYGIDTNFGTEAITVVSDSIRLTNAALTGELKATGQIPRSELSQPIITNVAFGSFGFEMEILTPDDPDGASHPDEAVNQIQELLKAANAGTDDELANIAASMHPRAVNKVAELLQLMRKHQAWFAMDYQGNTVRFQNDQEIKAATERLSQKNVEIDTDELIGTMIGFVPATGHFELHTADGTTIHGRIGTEIRYPYETAFRFTNQEVRATIRTVRVATGITNYILIGVSQL